MTSLSHRLATPFQVWPLLRERPMDDDSVNADVSEATQQGPTMANDVAEVQRWNGTVRFTHVIPIQGKLSEFCSV